MSKRLANKKPVGAAPSAGPAVRGPARGPTVFTAFLRRLRAGGRSNMYGAIPYLMHAFALDRDAAFRVVCEWVDRGGRGQPGPSARPRPLTPAVSVSAGGRSRPRISLHGSTPATSYALARPSHLGPAAGYPTLQSRTL